MRPEHCIMSTAKRNMSDLQTKGHESNQVFKDLFAGTVGGTAQVLVGQPLDIIKVRLQSGNSQQSRSMRDVAVQIMRQEGLTGFYKGTSLPLIGIGACVSIQFGCLEACKRAFRERNSLVSQRSSCQQNDLSFDQLYLAGSVAGMGNSLIAGPVEHIRIRLQTNQFNQPLDAVKKIWKSDGLFKGLYYGQTITMAREFHGYGMYFLAYESLVERHMRLKNCKRTDISPAWSILYGALAGYSMWLSCYPLDQIKTRIQTDALPSQDKLRKYHGIIDCAKKIWTVEGPKGFLKGLTPTLIRSPLVNGATFAAFESVMRLLS
ncbi:hypothetical protein O181_015128 [Austropuccinia psidii MF-1]|uniref:Uncharacterized protein n=1 Tax=Austropuccinia psidii MF-1 TaxID=1389203 RepID=A0A9Q3C1V9_9BASI|nr:hypothetical protein [Austropuccinia psidii MF-1]